MKLGWHMQSVIIVFYSLLPYQVCSQSWEAIPNPTGSTVLTLCANRGGVLFAGVPPRQYDGKQGGIYYSKDHGATWAPFSYEFGQIQFMGGLSNGDLYLTRSESYYSFVYRSTTDGYSWTKLDLNAHINCIVSKPPDTIFIGTPDVGLYRSTDNGKIWLQIGLAADIRAFAIAPDGAVLAGTNKGLYRSADNGLSWKHVGIDSARIEYLAINRSGVMLSLAKRSLRRSYDNGMNWTTIPGPDTAITAMASAPDQGILAGTQGKGIFISVDTGATWHGLSPPDFQVPVLSLWSDHDHAYVNSVYGLYRVGLNDGEVHWSHPRLDTLDITSLRISPRGTIFISTGPYYSPLPQPRGFYSINGGNDWLPFTPNLNLWPWLADSFGNCIAFQDSLFYSSSDDGFTWQRMASAQIPLRVVATRARLGGPWYGVGWGWYSSVGRFYASNDSGKNWKELAAPVDSSLLSIFVSSDGTVYVPARRWGGTEELYRSDDEGKSWTKIAGDAPWFSSQYFDGGNNELFCYGAYSGYYHSPDNGIHWAWTTPLDGLPVSDFLLHSNGNRYMATWRSVYRSDNAGLWTPVDLTASGPDSVTRVYSIREILEGTGGRLYILAGTLFRASAGLSSVQDNQGKIPEIYALYPNVPNPFNPSTSIRYTLPAASHVIVRIYDLLGRLAAEPVNGLETGGTHTIEWNGGEMASGIYFVRFEAMPSAMRGAKPFHAWQKIVLLK